MTGQIVPRPPSPASDVLVIGAGPAGTVAALRAADLGARTVLVTSSAFGGMAANDGPAPVRTLAHAAGLIREARTLSQYGIAVSKPALDYPRLLGRVREIVSEVVAHSSLRDQIDSAGVTVYENAGTARFADQYTVTTEAGLHLQADKIIICVGGASRQLPIPGFEFTSTHSGAFALTEVPRSMLVIGGGATGMQVASIFNAFGCRVELFETGPRILAAEDEDAFLLHVVHRALEAARLVRLGVAALFLALLLVGFGARGRQRRGRSCEHGRPRARGLGHRQRMGRAAIAELP